VGATSYDTVVAVWDGTGGCGAGLVQVGCSDDDFCGLPSQAQSSLATFTATAGVLYYISVGGFFGTTGNFDLIVAPLPVMTLTFTNSGPGTLGYTLSGGPVGGFAYTALTVNQGAFPNDVWFGVAMTNQEVISQLLFGFPFVTFLGATCGDSSAGPFGPLPPGFTVYGVTLAAPIGFTTPTAISLPTIGVAP
jgi:hypothetical protein